MSGLTATGWEALRAAEIREQIQAEIITRLDAAGLPSEIDFSRDTAGGILVDAIAVQLGRIWEAAGAVYDAFDPANATGQILDNIGLIRGVPRLQATFSRVTLTLTGVTGTVIPAGSEVEGGGDPASPARWATAEALTLAAGDNLLEAVATERGSILAGVSEIDQIVTPIAGWATVTNATPAVPGNDLEQNAPYRQRQRLGLVGAGSVGAIRLELSKVEGVTAVVVLENRGAGPLTIGSGATEKELAPHSILPIILPAGLTASQKRAVGEVLFRGAAGIRVGKLTGNDNSLTVEGDGFIATSIGWDDAGTDEVAVVVTLTLASGFTLADVEDDVEAAIEAYGASLTVGQSARLLSVQVACASIEGVVGATVTIDAVAADYDPDPFDLVVLTPITVGT